MAIFHREIPMCYGYSHGFPRDSFTPIAALRFITLRCRNVRRFRLRHDAAEGEHGQASVFQLLNRATAEKQPPGKSIGISMRNKDLPTKNGHSQ